MITCVVLHVCRPPLPHAVEILSEIQGLRHVVSFLQPINRLCLPTDADQEEDLGVPQIGGGYKVLVPVSMYSADSRGTSRLTTGWGIMKGLINELDDNVIHR